MLISLIEGCQIAFLLSKHSKTQTYYVYSYQRKDRMARTINRLSEWIISALITKQVFFTVWHCYLALLRGGKEEFSYHFKNS